MKVLVITNLYPPHSYGGYELSCQDVVRRWRDRGHDVTVLTTVTRRADVSTDAAERGVRRDLEWYWAAGELLRPPPMDRLRIERRNRDRLRSLLDALRPDVVSLWAMGGMSMSLISQCLDRNQPMAVVVEDDWLTYAAKVDPWLDAWSRRPQSLARVATVALGVPTAVPQLPTSVPVAFASDYLQRRATERGTIRFTASQVIPLGVDLTDFPLRPIAPKPWRGKLLCVGRIEPRKGFDVVVRALGELPDASLRLVGPGDAYVEELLRLASSLGVADRVTTGPVPRDKLADIYRDADAFVFPSRWEEPFGIVPLEAMSQATPVIATRRGGSAEFLVDEGNCLEVPVDDPAAVAVAVRRLAGSPDLRDRLTTEGLATAASLTIESFADALEALHLSVAGAAR